MFKENLNDLIESLRANITRGSNPSTSHFYLNSWYPPDKYSHIKTAKPTASWYHNLPQGRKNNTEVHVRGLGLYCEFDYSNPEKILEGAGSRELGENL